MPDNANEFDDEFLDVPTSLPLTRHERKFPPTNPSGLTDREEQRLIARSIREGWNNQERFPITESVEAIKKIPKKQLTSPQLALRAAIYGCEKGKTSRDKIRAAKLIVDMAKVNQADEIHEVPPTPIGVAVNVSNNSDGSATASVESSGPKVILFLPENGR